MAQRDKNEIAPKFWSHIGQRVTKTERKVLNQSRLKIRAMLFVLKKHWFWVWLGIIKHWKNSESGIPTFTQIFPNNLASFPTPPSLPTFTQIFPNNPASFAKKSLKIGFLQLKVHADERGNQSRTQHMTFWRFQSFLQAVRNPTIWDPTILRSYNDILQYWGLTIQCCDQQ